MLELKNINKYYNPGTINEMCLFDFFNLKILDQEFVSVVGSNGSGKTSMLNLICGSIPLDSGQILMNGKDISGLAEHKRNRNIGRVYQNPAMGTCPSMTILENMSIADNKGKSFNLRPGTNRQRQAIALIMATMTPIEFLILDEHTAALDPKTADIIMELTDKVVKEKKLTTIMVTHNLRYAIEYGNRIIMMHQGNVVLDKANSEKDEMNIDDILRKFNDISIECGN